jgi:hypothetical protein
MRLPLESIRPLTRWAETKLPLQVVNFRLPPSAFLQLPLGPLMSVQAQLGAPRRIAAYFDEQRTEIGVVNVEVVVVHVDGLVARVLEAAR